MFRKKLILQLTLLGFFCCNTFGITIDVAQVEGSIYPQEPLHLKIIVQQDEIADNDVRRLYIEHENIEILISGETESQESASLPSGLCRSTSNHYFRASLEDGRDSLQVITVNKWCSTELPAGNYTLTCKIHKFETFSGGQGVGVVTKHNPPIAWKFKVCILDANNILVRRRYHDLLLFAADSANNVAERQTAVDSIVYANARLALDSQLDILRGRIQVRAGVLDECHLADLINYLVRQNSANVASGLLQVFWELESQSEKADFVRQKRFHEYVLWAIHAMHSGDNLKVRQLTKEVVERYPRPRDPRPVPGLD